MKLEFTTMQVGAMTILLLTVSFLSIRLAEPGTQQANVLTNVLNVLFALFTVLALLRMRAFLMKINRRWALHIAFMVAGFGLWLVGELVWAYYAISNPYVVPGVTAADFAWLFGYAFMITGLAKANMETLVVSKRRDAFAATVFGIFAFIVAVFVLIPALALPADPLEKAFNLLYPIGDMVIIALVLRLAIAFMKSPLRLAWMVFFTGFAVEAIADSWYLYLALTGAYYPGHPYDFVYMAGYILIASGALLFEAMSRTGLALQSLGAENNAPPIAEIEMPREIGNAYSQLKEKLIQKSIEEAVSITTAFNPVDADLAIIELLAKDAKMGGVLLCFDRPHTYFLKKFRELGIDSTKICFVTIGKPGEPGGGNAHFVESAGELNEIKLALEEAVDKTSTRYGKAFVLIDCIPTLSLYSDINSLGRFLHDLSLELRKRGAYQVLLLPPEGEINKFVIRFCDTNISLT